MSKRKLTEVCDITTGKLDANAAVQNGKYPFFTCAPEPLRIDEYAFDNDVILLAGNNAQGNFHINRFTGKFNAYQRTYVITAKEGYDIDYIKYSLELSLKHLKNQAQGSQTKFLTMQILDDFMIEDISLEEQRKLISSIVALDKKIRNNKKIAEKCEQYASELYDYWFLQFEYPNTEGKAYKKSGGDLYKNESNKLQYPAEWNMGQIGDLGTITAGGTPSTTKAEYYCDNGIAWITPNDLSEQTGNMFISHGERDITELGLKDSSAIIMPAGSVLFSSRAPIGYIAISRNQVCTNQGFKSIVPNKGYDKLYVYYTLKKYTNSIVKQGGGTTFKEISGDVLASVEIPLPPKELTITFGKKIQTIAAKRNNLELENEKLKLLRDHILPLLLNGQLKIV